MLGLISLLTTTAFGATLNVSADGTATYSTIQDAIDAASKAVHVARTRSFRQPRTDT